MPVLDADITFRYSGGTGNAIANNSLGGQMSTTAWAGGVAHDLFDVISGDDNFNTRVDFRCVYIRNGSGTTPWGPNIYIWFSAVTALGANLSMGLDPAGVGNGTATGVAQGPIANELVVPSGVTFTAPTNKLGTTPASSTILVTSNAGIVPAGQGFALWIRREATNSSAQANDGATIQVQGDTPA